MMSLKKISLAEIVKKQYMYKLKANIDSYSSLIGIQLLAILFSFGGVMNSGSMIGNVEIDVKYYSADIVIVFTLISAFVTAITITTKPYRNQDFSFVTNRLSSNLSNILFLLTTSILGAVTAILSGNIIRVLIFFFYNQNSYSFSNGTESYFTGIIITSFYIFLVSSIGYFIGTLVQMNKLFVVLVPVVIFGSMFIEASQGKIPTMVSIFQFYIAESTIFIFILKTLLTTVLIFIASTAILNRMEVRR